MPLSITIPSITAEQVKAEAQRRIMVLVGAANDQDMLFKELNALMRTGALNDKRLGGEDLTTEEEAEAVLLRQMAAAIEVIRAASDVIEAMDPIPADYTDNSYWP